MNRNASRWLLGWALVGAILTVGCGESRPEGFPELHATTVTITQGGAPLAGADVTFYPQDSALSRWPVGGTTGSDGKVELTTFSKYTGVPAGTFKVTVQKVVTEGDPLPSHPGPNATRDQITDYDRALKTAKYEVFQTVEKNYLQFQTTPLEASITSGINDLTFDVGAPVKVKNVAASATAGAAAEFE